MRRTWCLFLILFISSNLFGQKINPIDRRGYKPQDVYALTIGINKYSGTLNPLNLCVADSQQLIKKLVSDNRETDERLESKSGARINQYNIKDVKYHMLNDEKATIDNIRAAFKKVISEASSDDYFVFMFSGYSLESQDNQTYIVPYLEDIEFTYEYENGSFKYTEFDKSKVMSLVELAKLMEQIPCKNQLIISEAGNGNSFGQNLITELFESNPLIAEGSERNRIILTTKEMGIEGGRCNGERMQNGFMMSYILENGNILDAFFDFNAYEFWLTRSEMLCPYRSRKYIASYQERLYRQLLLNNYKRQNSRGSKGNKVQVETKVDDKISETYAFILATDSYNEVQNSWENLKNPINDANVIETILRERYHVKTTKVYNKNKNEVLKAFLQFKQQLGENDQLLFFVAGHGYYSEAFSDGYLVMKDSNSLEDDITLDSYLSMAKLNRILDGVKCKQVFSIFDVCYGASFELNNADLPIENYSKTKFDNGLDAFIQEKNKNYSRIVLASGQYEVFDYWKDSEDHSPFASKLIKALKSEKQFLSPGRVFSYLLGNATTPILKQFGKHEARGDFLLKVK